MMSPSARRFVIDMFSSRYPLWCMPEGDVARVDAALGAGWEVVRVTEEADGLGDGQGRIGPATLEALRDAEVYCGFGVPRQLFGLSAKLRWVHSGAAGVRGSLYREMRESDVVFTNSAGTHAVPVAEHALAMMFYFARGLDRAEAMRRSRSWCRDRIACEPSPVGELSGATLGIVGLGGIGRALAERARALGMTVWGVKRNPERPGPPLADRVLGPAALDELLGAADYVVITVPQTPETDRWIGAEQLARMKQGAVLINVSRGSIVDEAALAAALRSGRLRGAGLDVYEREPLPAASLLWELENVCLTPHVAGVTPNFWERETGLILENTRRYLAGEDMLNVVDKRAGY